MIEFSNLPENVHGFLSLIKEKLDKVVYDEIGNVSVEFIFIDSETMEKMNQEYRGKEGPTDVLTFVYGNSAMDSASESENTDLTQTYAEGYLCIDVIQENAERFNTPFEKELLTVLVHSILHMSGYDHEYSTDNADEMFNKQSKYVQEIWSSVKQD